MRLMQHRRATVIASLLAAIALSANVASAAADTTSTALEPRDLTPVWGEPVVVTATVMNTEGTRTPAGNVTFTVDHGAPGDPVALDAGQAELPLDGLGVGDHQIVAGFSDPSGTFEPSGDTLTFTVATADADVSVTSQPNPAVAGQAVLLTAEVSGAPPSQGTPTGFVQFAANGFEIGPPQELDPSGTARLLASGPAGVYDIEALYLGDNHFFGALDSVDQTINRADTTTTYTGPTGPVAPGQGLVLSAVVAVSPPGDVNPTGSVQFTFNGAPVGAAVPLSDDLKASIPFTAPRAGGTIGVRYLGDDDTNPSSASIPLTVQGPAPVPAPAPAPKTTAGQLRALGAGLIRSLRARGLTALGGTSERFTAVEPGVLEQKVYSPKAPKSAAASAKRPIVVATARHAFSRAGSGTLKLRLTAAGRRAIRHAKSLRIAIVTRFTPQSGTPITVVQRLTVKARKGARTTSLDPGWPVRAIPPVARAARLGQAHGRS